MKLRLFNLSATGDKSTNEDFMAHLIRDDFALFVVADGLGGHLSGAKASRYFSEGLIEEAGNFAHKISDDPVTSFKRWFNAAVDQMANKFGDDDSAADAHTTCAILFVNDDLVMTVHCGDTRLYRMLPEKILWHSKDHSLIQDLIDSGETRESDIDGSSGQQFITKSVTVKNEQKPEIKIYPPIRDGDTFVLCTDGFWCQIKDSEFLQLAQPTADKDTLIKLMQMAYVRADGRCDNITVQLVKVDEA